jgi:hypothetical protein
MLTLTSRRNFLTAGSLGIAGLTLADLLRLEAEGVATPRARSVIMVYLFGGPSHLDMYDLKPEAPAEFRGEFKPIKTNVPGCDICELMPEQARIADRFTLVRNMDFAQGKVGAHSPVYLYGGDLADPKTATFPAIGSILSKVQPRRGSLPPCVALDNYDAYSGWLGTAHRPFVPMPLPAIPVLNDAHPAVVPVGRLKGLDLARGMTLDNLGDRAALRGAFDGLRRELESVPGTLAGVDAFHTQALTMLSDPRVAEAFDASREDPRLLDRYGKVPQLLLARRLAEAGVPLIQTTIDGAGNQLPALGNGWDTHGDNFKQLRAALPDYDRSISALITDLYDRGLDEEVLVVIWGEFGRTPKINGQAGRDHWPQAGFTLFVGGGLRMGQVIGGTDARGTRPVGGSYTPQNVLALVYRHLGIDPAKTTITDPTGRPHPLLSDPEPIKELI